MKLLGKSEINRLKAKDRQNEIQEGLKLAKRVDTLREVHSEEEASLEKFRAKAISKINGEIVGLTAQKESLVKEVSDLEGRRQKALIPLDKERQEIEKAKEELASQKLVSEHTEEILSTESQNLATARKEIEDEKKRVAGERAQTQDLLRDSDVDRKKAQNALIEASSLKLLAQTLKETVERECEARLKKVESRESAVSDRETKAQKERLELDKEWVLFKDRQAMLERDIKRNKK